MEESAMPKDTDNDDEESREKYGIQGGKEFVDELNDDQEDDDDE